MQTVEEIKSQALKLFKEKKFVEALPLYKQLWTEYRVDCNEWEGWRYAVCLKHIKDYKVALEICREVYKINPTFVNIKGTYAWCIYYTEIAIENVNNESNLFKAGEGIIKLTIQEDKSIKKEVEFPCIYSLSLLKILHYLNEKSIYNPEQILYWTDKLNPDLLETAPFKITGEDGKERELAPAKEQWYSLRSNALISNEQYEECIEVSQKALGLFEKLHYGNDIWFKRNIALSKEGLSDHEAAIVELMELLKYKNEWFIQKEISEIYRRQGKLHDALKYSVDAALNAGDVDKKLNLYKLLALLLKEMGKTNEAKAHIEFIFQFRKSKQWRIDNELYTLIKEFGIDENKDLNIVELQRNLKPLWEQLKFGGQELHKGTIRTIIAEGKAGFIDNEGNVSYYFSAKDFIGKRNQLKEGLKVSFYLQDSFDKKKNKPAKIAVNIKPV